MTTETDRTGYLELILGPMWSGKTSELLRIHRQFTYCGQTTCVINYEDDKRYSETMLVSHDKLMIPCIMSKSFADILQSDDQSNAVHDAAVILINEGQFFDDIVPFVRSMVDDYHKKVYICGLDGDFQRNPIGHLFDLIPICDKLTKLNSLCGICKNGTMAPFSFRISHETDQVVIGSDNYVPLCRKCYTVKEHQKNQNQMGVHLKR